MKVFMPHVHSRVDPITKTRIPIVNLERTVEQGMDLKLLVPLEWGNPTPEDVGGFVMHITAMLDNLYEPGDRLMMIGDPVLSGAAMSWLVLNGYKVAALRYDPQRKTYEEMEVDIV